MVAFAELLQEMGEYPTAYRTAVQAIEAAEKAIEIATIDGAGAIGWSDQIGSLDSGVMQVRYQVL